MEEPWVPISDWGRSFREYRASQPAVRATVRRAPSKPFVSTEDQRAKYRAKWHRRKARLDAGRVEKLCPRCLSRLYATNKVGICRRCQTPAEIYEAKRIPRPKCTVEGCEKELNRHNKSGLCSKHGAPLRKKAYAARKRAA